jgi:SAM-dependent methyltransferase/uncharacterized protein YbaR (Trm112 family)
MLRSLVDKLLCPTCCSRAHFLALHTFTHDESGQVKEGVLLCPACGGWYPIRRGLLELVVSSLLDPQELDAFCSRYRTEMACLGLRQDLEGTTAGLPSQNTAFGAQLKQREHFDWYAENTEQDYMGYQQTPFWVAADEAVFRGWKSQLQAGGWLLDIGCANGRSAFPFVKQGVTVIGFDISKKMVRQAIERAEWEGAQDHTTFFVADGSQLPFRDESFEYALIYGVLHHLPAPRKVCVEVLRVLKKGGIYFGSENNQTIFRGLFDVLMKLLPLWSEEAGEQPLISRQMLQEWVRGASVRMRCGTSVFLPPHLFNLMGTKVARVLLPATDRLFSWAPGLRHQGGLIVFEIQKNAA